jgi:hypothetical protein
MGADQNQRDLVWAMVSIASQRGAHSAASRNDVDADEHRYTMARRSATASRQAVWRPSEAEKAR